MKPTDKIRRSVEALPPIPLNMYVMGQLFIHVADAIDQLQNSVDSLHGELDHDHDDLEHDLEAHDHADLERDIERLASEIEDVRIEMEES